MWIAASVLLVLLVMGSLFAATRAEATHYYTGYRWGKGYVYWKANPSVPSSFVPVIESAGREWASIWSGFRLTQGTGPYTLQQGYVYYFPFSVYLPDQSPEAWGATAPSYLPSGQIIHAEMYIDSDKQWNLNNQGNFNPVGNLRAVVLHEFGHWVALHHTSEWSIMCSLCVLEQGKKTLSAHDIATVPAVYAYPGGGGDSPLGNPGGIPKLG
jgi:hypothetical protein